MPTGHLLNEFEGASALKLSIPKFREICALRQVHYTQYGPTKYFRTAEIEALRKTPITEGNR